WYAGEVRTAIARHSQHAPKEIRGGKWTRGIVDRDPLRAVARGECRPHRVLAASAARDTADAAQPGLDGQRVDRLPALLGRRDCNGVEAGSGSDRSKRPGQQRAPAEVNPQLVPPEPLPATEGGNNDRAGQLAAT